MKYAAFLLAIALLGGCGSSPEPAATESVETTETEVTESEPATTEEPTTESDDDSPLQSVGDTLDFEGGTLELVKIIDVGETHTTGPFELEITKVSVINYRPTDTFAEQFDGKDQLTLISLGMEVENTSTDTASIYPDQATLVTNTKEQLTPSFLFTEAVGGDFLGEVIKSGNVVFVAEAEPVEIKTITYTVNAPHDESLASIGEETVLEFAF
jgi:hypothetical protein